MIDLFKQKLKASLSPERFSHSLEVAQLASSLASHYGLDPQKAEIAGLLHDCAKDIPFPLLLEKAEAYGIHLGEVEKKNPKLLHAIIGAEVAFHEFGIKDPDILSAIAKHTTGSKDMTPLDQIIYVADYIDPLRELPNLELIHQMARSNLSEAVAAVAKDVIEYLVKRERLIHPSTVECFNTHVEKKNQL